METVTQNAHEAIGAAQAEARLRPQRPRPRAGRAAGRARTCPKRRCGSSATTSPTCRAPRSSASMVVMEDGLPKRSDYRRFKIRHQPGQDDFASMEEVLTRRFRRYLQDRDEGARSGKRFAYPPNLVLIDGGKGQLGVAVRVLEELGLEDIAVASLAKRFEEVYLPGDSEPVRIPRDSEALYLLQQVRDEAHRFAITYHRQLRDKKMTQVGARRRARASAPSARRRLLKEHGSVKRLRALTEDELVAIPWLPEPVARALYAQLHGERSPRRDPRRHHHHRHVGRRALGRGRRARGPRVLRDRQPAARARHQGRRARPGHRRPRSSFGLVDRRAVRRVRRRSRRRAGRAARARARARACCSSTPPTTCSCAATRRAAASTRSPADERVSEGIAAERQLLEDLKGRADIVRRHHRAQRARAARPPARAVRRRPRRAGALQTSIVSFGYKHGLPIDVDLVFDCRFLPNPHWVDELRPLPGTDAGVRDYVLAQPEAAPFLDELERLFALLLPAYVREGKSYLSIGIGCTGGRHRSVVIADRARPTCSSRSASRRASTTGTSTVADGPRGPASSRSAAGTGSPPRCARSAATRVRSPRS